MCESAQCPNIGECWNHQTATFMLLGDICTRRCGFCAVPKGKPGPIDWDEPRRVAEAVATLGLKHAVVTSVNRDDDNLGGARVFAETIRQIRELTPGCRVEVLIPDFQGLMNRCASCSTPGPTCSITTPKACLACIAWSAPARAMNARCGCWRTPRNFRPEW